MTPELTEAEIVQILREKVKASAHNRYLLNRERYIRRANIRYALQREEILARARLRYATNPEFRMARMGHGQSKPQEDI